jgi:hypothetical protein
MPQIIVAADRGAAFGQGTVTLREGVTVADFQSEHFANQLVERLGWAVGDADQLERVPGTAAEPERAELTAAEPDPETELTAAEPDPETELTAEDREPVTAR